ncbi:MAG: aryl-sulfate sulfotransferase, partial [Acidimicrobiaceae bacterium]|nr:aryl-sulfate sulfotransferase [Acidimicrobiaceae bacterium]
GAVEWVWERSAGRNNWVTIEGATGAVYVPRAADAGEHLRVTALYGDSHSKAQTAVAALHSVVLADLLSALSVSTGDSMLSSVAVAGIETAPDGGDSSGTGVAPGGGSVSVGSAAVNDPVALAGWRLQRPGFDARTLHYSVGCADFDTMTLNFAAADGASRLAVDGVAYANPGAGRPVTAQVEVGRDSDVVVSVTNGSGAETRYVVHCLATDTEPFTVQSSPGATEELLLVPRNTDLLILDSNGVVRHHIELAPEDARASFRFYPDCGGGEFCYSYTIRAPYPRHVILDEDLEIIDAEVYTVAPLTEVGTHDFRVLEDGSYLLLAFEPAVRDFSHLTFPDVNGDRFGPETESIDSAIQIVTPEGEPRLTWNSYDHMPLEDCTHHRFPPDNPRWGQINSIGVYNGEIVASFRGCNRVLGIDPVTGVVNWRLGPTNQDEPGFASPRLDPAPLDIVGDPQLQFCGQHGASVTADGRLLLYDNGANCSVNPWTGENLLRPDRTYSRAVEYQLDFESHEAVYVREHSLGGTADRIGWATGQVERLADGDWLISWGSNRQVAPPGPPYPVEDVASATLVDPATGKEKLTLLWHPTLPVQEIRLTAMPAWALARQPSPLAAVVSAHGTSAAHGGGGSQASTSDRLEVVVTFNQPVVDFTADSPSLRARGATVAAVTARTVAGAPANSYTVTLAPSGSTDDISFELAAGGSCAAGGICTAAGTPLDVVDDLVTLGQQPGA